ncbi:hypothetical protein FGB62_54g118 [Gracilaria domingensis]|nr:hypothetical protein FGB62_54g118 [Gracilaria domingensis]
MFVEQAHARKHLAIERSMVSDTQIRHVQWDDSHEAFDDAPPPTIDLTTAETQHQRSLASISEGEKALEDGSEAAQRFAVDHRYGRRVTAWRGRATQGEAGRKSRRTAQSAQYVIELAPSSESALHLALDAVVLRVSCRCAESGTGLEPASHRMVVCWNDLWKRLRGMGGIEE